MARKRVADMTLAQKQARENDKFRADTRAAAIDDYEPLDRGDDIDKFRRDSYRQALRDAKANR